MKARILANLIFSVVFVSSLIAFVAHLTPGKPKKEKSEEAQPDSGTYLWIPVAAPGGGVNFQIICVP